MLRVIKSVEQDRLIANSLSGSDCLLGVNALAFMLCLARVQRGVQLDGRFCTTNWSSLEQAKTQIDGRGAQGVYRVLEIESNQIDVTVELECWSNQHWHQVRPDALIPRFFGIGEHRSMLAVGVSGILCLRRFDKNISNS